MSAPRIKAALSGVLAAAAMAVGLAGCGSSASTGAGATISASAMFSDVSDLVAGAPVQYANISVGSVKAISLQGGEAKVVMTIDKSAAVPADVIAQLRQTSILGEHYVSLVVPSADTTSNEAATSTGVATTTGSIGSAGLLHNGSVINQTEFVPGIQQLVSAGASVFGAINGAQLAQIINNGAEGFGGQSAALRQLINDFNTVLAGYSSRDSEIKSVIDNFDKFNATLAPNAQQDALSITNLAQTTAILAQQSAAFENVLQSLNDLAVQGHSILSTGLSQTEDQIKALAAVANQLASHQKDLAVLIDELPGHNSALANLVVNNYAQILEDIIVCGLPGGGSGNTPDTTCGPSGGGS